LAEFNHNVSHELRTPISIVKSNLELMEYVEDKKEFMQSSMDELKEMENIINSMLIISKNKKPTNFETVDIEEITTKYVEKLKENYEKNLDFEFINN
jgi:signal transduction histidine kinase